MLLELLKILLLYYVESTSCLIVVYRQYCRYCYDVSSCDLISGLSTLLSFLVLLEEILSTLLVDYLDLLHFSGLIASHRLCAYES